MMSAMGLSYIALIMTSDEVRFSVPILLRVFIIKGYWVLLKTFSVHIEMIMLFLCLILLDVMDHFYWFVTVELSLHSWAKSHFNHTE
jgi:hypothetical protein